jgi:hypothetical protein
MYVYIYIHIYIWDIHGNVTNVFHQYWWFNANFIGTLWDNMVFRTYLGLRGYFQQDKHGNGI